MTSMFRAVALAIAGLCATSAAYAVTIPNSIGDFDTTPSQVLQATAKGWSDPAFGGTGWTHRSAWGSFHAQKGQIITIKAVAPTPDFHPGVSVWFRPAQDTAPDNYVGDHFYAQNAPVIVLGATDPSTNAPIGDIFLVNPKYAFDGDGKPAGWGSDYLKGVGHKLKDGVAGQLVMKYTAPRTGAYIFVLGGVNPGPSITAFTTKYDIQTDVMIENP